MASKKQVGSAEIWLSRAEAVISNGTPADAKAALSILGEVRKQQSWWDRLFNFSFNRRVIRVARRAHAILLEAEREGNEVCARNCLENARDALERDDFAYAASALERADDFINLLSGALKSRLRAVRRQLGEELLSRSA